MALPCPGQWAPCLSGWGVLGAGGGGAEGLRKQEVLYPEKLKPREGRGLAKASRGLSHISSCCLWPRASWWGLSGHCCPAGHFLLI